ARREGSVASTRRPRRQVRGGAKVGGGAVGPAPPDTEVGGSELLSAAAAGVWRGDSRPPAGASLGAGGAWWRPPAQGPAAGRVAGADLSGTPAPWPACA